MLSLTRAEEKGNNCSSSMIVVGKESITMPSANLLLLLPLLASDDLLCSAMLSGSRRLTRVQ